MHSRRIHSIYAGRRSLPVPHHSEQNRFQKSATWRTQYYTVSSGNIKEDWNKVRFYSGKRFLSGQRHKSHPALLTLRQSVSNGKEDFDLGNDCLSLTIDDTPSQHGTLKIARLEKGDVGAASVVLTRSFAASPQGMVIDDVR